MIEIKISGMGGTLGPTLFVIEEALKSVGANVQVNDAYPYWSKKTILSNESKARMLEIAKSEQVLIITNHIPWGG